MVRVSHRGSGPGRTIPVGVVRRLVAAVRSAAVDGSDGARA